MSISRHPPRSRPAALAGRWYPADVSTLRASVQRHLDAASAAGVAPLLGLHGVISPHAGHIYSGPMAGRAFATLPGGHRRAVLVGPAHRVGFRGLSAGDYDRYEIPGASFPVDRDAVAAATALGLVGFVPEAHRHEHCLEIMLPFLAEATRVGPSEEPCLPIVPLLVGQATVDQVAAALEALLQPGDLLIVSSDLSHFHPYDEARARDTATLDAIVRGEVDRLTGHDACGYRAIQGASRVADARGWRRTLLGYESSGDTAGDRASVVGYGAVALT